ncbi:ATP-binding protein [Bifidobacterium bifidum]|uniref:ATP-binding protein n=2 Tax=Bifidobacterium bifidum TaxID=1681 RepID=UPI00321C06C3|nr:ATP-binding protein [Bifidobacterium bifidum]
MTIGCMPDANRAVNVCDINGQQNHQTRISIDSTTRPPENAADAEDLIQPFHRGDDTRMANRPGHGLGLSIAKACTDAMQATLAVSCHRDAAEGRRHEYSPAIASAVDSISGLK